MLPTPRRRRLRSIPATASRPAPPGRRLGGLWPAVGLALALAGCVDDFPVGGAPAEAGLGADLGPGSDAAGGVGGGGAGGVGGVGGAGGAGGVGGAGGAGGGPGGAGGGPGGAGGGPGGAGGGPGGQGGEGGEGGGAGGDASTENPDPDQGAPTTDAEVADGAAVDGETDPQDPDLGVPGDLDGDGVPGGEDCDDDAPAVFPGAIETCNGVDDDCDGNIDEDATPVGVCVVGLGPCRAEGAHTCIDGVAGCSATPGVPVREVAGNGVDDDCNGLVDEIQCPPNTLRSDDGRSCMWRGRGERSWDFADTACDHIDIGGTPGRLATLETDSQWRVAQQLAAGRNDPMWVGARRNRNSPTGWRWTRGTNLSINAAEGRWANGEPNNAGFGESCAELRPDGRLNDASCLSLNVPLCELEYSP